MGNVIVVQQICTSWTKVSRGGENAAKRNAVPEVASLPVQHLIEVNKNNTDNKDDLVLIHHRVTCEEENGFSPREKIHLNPTLRPFIVGGVTIQYSDDEVNAVFQYDRGCGAPDRSWARKTIHMTVNQWGQIAYNGRFVAGWEGPWYYEKTVVNVGIFERLRPDVFTKQEPASRFTAMGDLF